MSRFKSMVPILALLLAFFLPARSASARLAESHTYTYDQLWRSAVRLIAVDFRFPITSRDQEVGYLLFDYRENGRTYNGSIELVRSQNQGPGSSTQVVCQVQAMPSYVERMMLDRLTRKLRDDYGTAPVAPRPRRERNESPSEDEAQPDDEESTSNSGGVHDSE